MAFPLGVVLFGFLVRLKQLCTQFGRLGSRYMPTCGWIDYGSLEGIMHELSFCLNWIPLIFWFCFVFSSTSPHWSLFSCVLLSPGRFGSLRAQVGLGFAVVGWFRRIRLPSPPLVLVRFRRPPFFLVPCPFKVCPLRARCVGVGVFSFPLPFAFPLFVSRLSNFHLMFMFISFSLSFFFTFISSCGLTPCLAGCVCVERLHRR